MRLKTKQLVVRFTLSSVVDVNSNERSKINKKKSIHDHEDLQDAALVILMSVVLI